MRRVILVFSVIFSFCFPRSFSSSFERTADAGAKARKTTPTTATDGTHVCGNVSGIWTAECSPYYVDCEIHIPTDSMLLIEPGCSIIFTGHYKFCVDSNAVLKAIGTPTDSIVFTAQDTVLTDSTGGHHGIRFYHAAEGCTLMYCRIEYGNAFGDHPDNCGGGIYCEYSSPMIENNTISKNSADHGGGIGCLYSSNPTIANNTISGDLARSSGGGIYCNRSSPEVVNNTIFRNSANHRGGAIYCEWYSNLTITNNQIDENTAADDCGGICCLISNPTLANNTISRNSAQRGGGVWCDNSRPIISNNIITENSAVNGGGIFCRHNSNPTIISNIISRNSAIGGSGIYCLASNPTVINNAINRNSAWIGGGICCEWYSSPVLVNNTISENSADGGGGIYCRESNLTVFNSILWQNTASLGSEIFVRHSGDRPCILFVAYTDIDSSECYIETGSEIIWGPGNINADPLFADSLFHLSETSPCIDAGAESIYVPIWGTVIYAPGYDFEGGDRPQGAGWDIGADEYGSSIIAEHSQNKPKAMEISVYPNPFNSSCVIAAPAEATIEICNLLGKVVKKFPSSAKDRGMRRYIWQPDKSIPAGIYLVCATTPQRATTAICAKRIVYLK